MTWLESFSLKRRLLWTVLGALWVAGTVAGLAMLTRYSTSPGEMQPVPSRWPMASRIRLSDGRDTLVLFAHPHCPCTKASLGELEKVVAHYRDAVTPWVVFFKPAEDDADWDQTDLWRTAAAIPGVHLVSDAGGAEARRFYALTSGQTLLYSPQGELLFNGGITFARGHSGDNAGEAAIESCLSGQSHEYCQTPVFGCPIAVTAEKE